MPPTKNKKRSKTPPAVDRRGKKKVSILTQEKIDYIDWKDVNLLRRFASDRAKIRARRVTGNSAQQQRDVALAIKNAREMALLPYTSRITTQRGGRGDRRQRDDDRRLRDNEAPKRPSPPRVDAEKEKQEKVQLSEASEAPPEIVEETTAEEIVEETTE